MNKKDKDGIYDMFAKAFHEIVPPLFENVAKTEDIDRLERKFEAQQNRLDRHGKQLEAHEKRIHTLESAVQ